MGRHVPASCRSSGGGSDLASPGKQNRLLSVSQHAVTCALEEGRPTFVRRLLLHAPLQVLSHQRGLLETEEKVEDPVDAFHHLPHHLQ
jgi:hypothetical protein